jgi:hypothetical protein
MKQLQFVVIAIIIALFLQEKTNGQSKSYYSSFKKSKKNLSQYINLAEELMNQGLYFTSAPLIKEFLHLNKKPITVSQEKIIERNASIVGFKFFKYISKSTLTKSNSSTLNFALSSKNFESGDYRKTLKFIKKVKKSSILYPYSLLLKATSLAILNKNNEAIKTFEKCDEISSKYIKRGNTKLHNQKLTANRDYCIIGKARALFNEKKYNKSNLTYLDLDKRSYVWPEILYEEAWNSLYLKNQNRTLGKLVTYKSPILNHVYRPGVYVLSALSYFELCLYNDSLKIIKSFSKKYEQDMLKIKNILIRNKNKLKYFYNLSFQKTQNKLLNQLIESMKKNYALKEMILMLKKSYYELNKINGLRLKSSDKLFLKKSIKETISIQKKLIAGFIKQRLFNYNQETVKTLNDLSNIKLEILSKEKSTLYKRKKYNKRERGSLEYLKRNDKQYFFTFNNEFWVDELGDYVFALKSECR